MVMPALQFHSALKLGVLQRIRGMKRLSGKVAIVTGSSLGIGFAIAKRLAEEGAKVVICSRKENNVEAAVEQMLHSGLDAFGIQCHVGKSSDRVRLIDETIKRYGRLDILVLNAATNPAIKPLLDTDESEWDHIFHVNVKSAFLLMKEAVPHIKKHGQGGSIVIISSVSAYTPLEFIAAYSVSKTALLGLTKAASLQLAKEGIRVNNVAPGAIHTRFIEGVMRKAPVFLPNVPMNRFGTPEEVSGVVAFLASDDASYITGETILPSGGMPSHL